jgi:hypothetical protein
MRRTDEATSLTRHSPCARQGVAVCDRRPAQMQHHAAAESKKSPRANSASPNQRSPACKASLRPSQDFPKDRRSSSEARIRASWTTGCQKGGLWRPRRPKTRRRRRCEGGAHPRRRAGDPGPLAPSARGIHCARPFGQFRTCRWPGMAARRGDHPKSGPAAVGWYAGGLSTRAPGRRRGWPQHLASMVGPILMVGAASVSEVSGGPTNRPAPGGARRRGESIRRPGRRRRGQDRSRALDSAACRGVVGTPAGGSAWPSRQPGRLSTRRVLAAAGSFREQHGRAWLA